MKLTIDTEFLINEVENKSTKLSSYQKMLKRIRGNYPKAYFPWTQEDDLLLKSKVKMGLKTSLIAEIHGRTPSAINSRIKKQRLKRKKF